MKAPQVMIEAVRQVRPNRRLEAKRFAEERFFHYLTKVQSDLDFYCAGNDPVELVAETVASEIGFYFR